MFFCNQEKLGYIVKFNSPSEFYVKFFKPEETVSLSKNETLVNSALLPNKNEVVANAKFFFDNGEQYVLCEVLEDMKYDEMFCQVMLSNVNLKLKVDYRKLRHLSSHLLLEDDNVFTLKIFNFSPLFPNTWNEKLLTKLRNLVLFNRFIVQFKSYKVDPADGVYPVLLLDERSRKVITDEFVDGLFATRDVDYYRAALEFEINRLFLAENKPKSMYTISCPIVKTAPEYIFKEKQQSTDKTNAVGVVDELSSAKSKLNLKAIPFIPNGNNNSYSVDSKSTAAFPLVSNSSSIGFPFPPPSFPSVIPHSLTSTSAPSITNFYGHQQPAATAANAFFQQPTFIQIPPHPGQHPQQQQQSFMQLSNVCVRPVNLVYFNSK